MVNENQEPKAEEIVLTQELINDLTANPSKIKDMPSHIIQEITRQQFGVLPTSEPVVEVEEEVEVKPNVEVEPQWKIKARELAQAKNDANTNKQRLENEKKKAERLAAEKKAVEEENLRLKSVKAPTVDDVFDEKEQLNIRDLLAQQAAEIKALKERDLKAKDEELKRANDRIKELNIEETFHNLSRLQEEFPELKTTRNIGDIDREWVAFQQALVTESGKPWSEAANLLNNDAEFKSAMEAKGIRVPDEYETYAKVIKIHNAAPEINGVKDYVGEVLKQKYQAQKSGTQETNSSQTQSVQTVPVTKKTPEPAAVLLDTNRGNSNANGFDMTPEKAKSFLNSLKDGHTLNDAERATLQYLTKNAVLR